MERANPRVYVHHPALLLFFVLWDCSVFVARVYTLLPKSRRRRERVKRSSVFPAVAPHLQTFPLWGVRTPPRLAPGRELAVRVSVRTPRRHSRLSSWLFPTARRGSSFSSCVQEKPRFEALLSQPLFSSFCSFPRMSRSLFGVLQVCRHPDSGGRQRENPGESSSSVSAGT